MCCAGLQSLGLWSEEGERLSHCGLWSRKPHGGWTSGQGDIINIITHLRWFDQSWWACCRTFCSRLFSLIQLKAGLYFSMGGLEQVENHITFQMQIRRCDHPYTHTPSVLLTKQKKKKKMMSLFLLACLFHNKCFLVGYILPTMTMIHYLLFLLLDLSYCFQ